MKTTLKEQIKILVKEEFSIIEAASIKYEEVGYERGLKDLDQDTWGDITTSLSTSSYRPRNQSEAVQYAKGYVRAMREHIDAIKNEQESVLERLFQQMNNAVERFDAVLQRTSSKKSFD